MDGWDAGNARYGVLGLGDFHRFGAALACS